MRRSLTKENLRNIFLKYNSRKELQIQDRSAYNAAWKMNILDELCQHMKPTPTFHTHESAKVEALKYSNVKDFKKYSLSAHNYSRRNGIFEELTSHMSREKNIFSNDEIHRIALSYNTLYDFRTKARNIYQTARTRDLLDKITAHMPKKEKKKRTKNEQFTVEKLIQLANLCKTRNELNKKFNKAYQAAGRLNILDQICAHMPIVDNNSFLEQSLFETIQKQYPKAQKFRIKKNNLIPNKPHIHGFELDIYIPELRKGIEFDGTYHHSVKGLRRGRPHWPMEDVENYHKIKDEYFLSKGIKILHIKEEKWLQDKDGCIQKCLNFLKHDIE